MFETTYILGGNIALKVEFTYVPGWPAVWGDTLEAYQPAEDEEIEIQRVTCNSREVDIDDIHITYEGTTQTLEADIMDFISTTRDDWMVGPEEQ